MGAAALGVAIGALLMAGVGIGIGGAERRPVPQAQQLEQRAQPAQQYVRTGSDALPKRVTLPPP